jgi:hypothetical protein
MASAGASGTVTVERLKLYVAKTLQKFTVLCVKFVVGRQWALEQFPVGLPVFVKDVSA